MAYHISIGDLAFIEAKSGLSPKHTPSILLAIAERLQAIADELAVSNGRST